jgi:hypothetical protein
MSRFTRLLLAATLLGGAGIISSTAAFAGQTVDPAMLNPPPFAPNATCALDGNGTTCTADFAAGDTNHDVGPVCQVFDPAYTFDVIVNDQGRFHWTWRYDTSGKLTEFTSQFQLHETDMNAVTGTTGIQDAGRMQTTTFDPSGDVLSNRYAGNVASATVQGSGLVFHDVGVLTLLPDQVIIHGPHDLFEMGGSTVFAEYCAALAA